ncbi:MAG: sigma factor [Pseudolabrys sp.]
MQTTSDEVLISRIAGGDPLAMQVLYARHHVRVYRFVLRVVRNEATPEDLISEVFLDVWRASRKVRGPFRRFDMDVEYCAVQGPVGIATAAGGGA